MSVPHGVRRRVIGLLFPQSCGSQQRSLGSRQKSLWVLFPPERRKFTSVRAFSTKKVDDKLSGSSTSIGDSTESRDGSEGAATGRDSGAPAKLSLELTEPERFENNSSRDPRLEMALSVHRMLIRSLHRIKKSKTAQISTNYELNGILRCICSEFNLRRNHRITDRNRHWVLQSVSQLNPHAKIKAGQEIVVLSPEMMEGKYHLIQDLGVKADKMNEADVSADKKNVSEGTENNENNLTSNDGSTDVEGDNIKSQEYRQTEPIFLSYDYMLLEGRPYVRCNENDSSSYEVCPDIDLANVRSVLRRIFQEKLAGPEVSIAEITDTGFRIIGIVRNFIEASSIVNKDRERQKRAVQREFDALRRHKNRDAVKIRQSKERIKELWLRHPDPIIQERLYRVCDSMGQLDGTCARANEPQDIAQCIQEVDEILCLDPLNVEALHTRAILFSLTSNHRACIADLEQILTFIEPRHFPSLHTLFNLHQAQGNEEGMQEIFTRLQKLCPKDPDLPVLD